MWASQMDPQQYDKIIKYMRDGKISHDRDHRKLKKKFLAMYKRFKLKETINARRNPLIIAKTILKL